jgi:hypothetical protein
MNSRLDIIFISVSFLRFSAWAIFLREAPVRLWDVHRPNASGISEQSPAAEPQRDQSQVYRIAGQTSQQEIAFERKTVGFLAPDISQQ